MKLLRMAVVSLLFAAIGFALPAQNGTAAKTFVQKVYNDYKNPDWQHQWQRQKRFFSPGLQHLIAADERANRGYAPQMDFDPICNCQDSGNPGDLKVQSVTLTAEGLQRATATVLFTIIKEQRTVALSLLKTPSGWRIDDISTKDVPSLRKFLSK